MLKQALMVLLTEPRCVAGSRLLASWLRAIFTTFRQR
jgi:hypothetical protein